MVEGGGRGGDLAAGPGVEVGENCSDDCDRRCSALADLLVDELADLDECERVSVYFRNRLRAGVQVLPLLRSERGEGGQGE